MEAGSTPPCPCCIWSSANTEKNLNIQLSLRDYHFIFLIQIAWAICQFSSVLPRQTQSSMAFLLLLKCSWELVKSQVAKQPQREQDECVCSVRVCWGEV